MAWVFSYKHSPTSMGNVSIYSVGTESVYQKWQSGKTECFAIRKLLAGRPYLRTTHETQLSPSILTLRILVMCRAHASFRGMLSREIPAKTLLSSIAWVFTHSLSITQPLQLNPTINTGYKRLNKVTIKFGTDLKPTKHIVVNYNFTRSLNWGMIAWLFYVLFENYCGVVVVILVLCGLVELSVSSICKFLLDEIKLLICLFTHIIYLLFFFVFA